MFNAETEAGFDQTKAIASFLAQHYSGDNPNYGKVSNWIIGNEINNQQWNYMGPMDLTNYVKAYQKAFRSSTQPSRAPMPTTGYIFTGL